MANFNPADFNTVMNYLEYLENDFYKIRNHYDPIVRSSINYDELILGIYRLKDRCEEDFIKGLFNGNTESSRNRQG